MYLLLLDADSNMVAKPNTNSKMWTFIFWKEKKNKSINSITKIIKINASEVIPQMVCFEFGDFANNDMNTPKLTFRLEL